MNKEDKTYKLPDTYFENFQDRLHTQIELEGLLGTDIKSGFKVPEGYFDELSRKLSKIPAKEEIAPKVISLKTSTWVWPSISIAAAILLFFGIYTVNINAEQTQLDLEDIATYLDVESTNLYAQDIAALLTEEEVSTFISTDIVPEEDELINYLETYTNPYDLLLE